MELTIQTIPRGSQPTNSQPLHVYLKIDFWNDFSFVTMFQVYISDETGTIHELGSVKIGFENQTTQTGTYESLQWPAKTLPEKYFSLGTDVAYYQNIKERLTADMQVAYLRALRDVVADQRILDRFSAEQVFKTSLLRDTSLSSIRGQFSRVLDGGAILTDFDFEYVVEQTEKYAGFELEFKVIPASKPPSNIHAIIGRNGVGKTTFLNDLVRSAMAIDGVRGEVRQKSWFNSTRIGSDYFSGVVSVSFSAFDPFTPPEDKPEVDGAPFYHYIGIKDSTDIQGHTLKSTAALKSELVHSIKYVLSEKSKADRWREAIQTLESDTNFKEIDLQRFANDRDNLDQARLFQMSDKLSSGHAIVLLTITKLVSFVQEKTLVLIDEPESHLHPPLLSAFTRSLSDLLYNRNGVAIIATHSPVVLQEVPKSCSWKLVRSRNRLNASRPEIETFAENVGTLTREVFGLEVVDSGFHRMLTEEVEKGKSFDEIMEEYNFDIGFEGQALIRALIAHRDHG